MKRILSILLTAILLMGLCLPFAASAAGEDITAAFIDLNFRAAVYQQIGKTAPAPIYDTDVAGVTRLDVFYQKIQSLAGLEYFVELKFLECGANKLTELPALPPSLEYFRCCTNELTALPSLPSGLTSLDCEGNIHLAALPALPQSLTHLNYGGTGLTALPTLPQSLTHLSCGGTGFTSLPTLPSSLTYLNCSNNPLGSLPALPPNLESLICENTGLTEFPALPASLENLVCRLNQLGSLPTLPSGLKSLWCEKTQLASLPALPSGMRDLNCAYNQLTALPTLPSSLQILDCSHNQLTSLPELPSGLYKLYCNDNLLTGINVSGLRLDGLHCQNNNMINESEVVGFGRFILGEARGWDYGDYAFHPQYNMRRLKATLEDAKGYGAFWYTAKSWDKLQAAIAAAQAVVDDENATELQIEQRIDALNGAMMHIVTKWDNFWNTFLEYVLWFFFWPILSLLSIALF